MSEKLYPSQNLVQRMRLLMDDSDKICDRRFVRIERDKKTAARSQLLDKQFGGCKINTYERKVAEFARSSKRCH